MLRILIKLEAHCVKNTCYAWSVLDQEYSRGYPGVTLVKNTQGVSQKWLCAQIILTLFLQY